jgi:hypothetical protein
MTELVHAQCKLSEKPTTKSNTGELKEDSVFRESIPSTPKHRKASDHHQPHHTRRKNTRFVALTRAQIRKKALAREAHAQTTVKSG